MINKGVRIINQKAKGKKLKIHKKIVHSMVIFDNYSNIEIKWKYDQQKKKKNVSNDNNNKNEIISCLSGWEKSLRNIHPNTFIIIMMIIIHIIFIGYPSWIFSKKKLYYQFWISHKEALKYFSFVLLYVVWWWWRRRRPLPSPISFCKCPFLGTLLYIHLKCTHSYTYRHLFH